MKKCIFYLRQSFVYIIITLLSLETVCEQKSKKIITGDTFHSFLNFLQSISGGKEKFHYKENQVDN
jgi:hypothetical protein